MLSVVAHVGGVVDPSIVLAMALSEAASIAQVVLPLVTAVAVIVTLVSLRRERETERKQRDIESYNQMADKWSEFLVLCLEHQDLGFIPLALREEPSMELPQLLLYSALIQLLNRAYVTYANASPEVREERYVSGWEDYLIGLLHHKEFREAWSLLGSYYDPEFADYVDHKARAYPRAGVVAQVRPHTDGAIEPHTDGPVEPHTDGPVEPHTDGPGKIHVE